MDVAIGLDACQGKQWTLRKWTYSIVPENFFQLELGEYSTYGIQVITPDYIEILHDVSVCKKTVERLVRLLNYYQVSSIHLYDVIMDMLP